MTSPAKVIAPAERIYRGGITRPERWATWVPNKGDILVCTPPKCGTTWTQTILAMLVHGGAELPAKLPVLSPWVDAAWGSRQARSRRRLPRKRAAGSSRHTPPPMAFRSGRALQS